jgi:DNA invertase Pin-like site-specific DNA recombinase
MGPFSRLPTVIKFEALPASRLTASLASVCRAKTSRVFAALVEKERSLNSTRTRQALSAAKARGVTLGNPKLSVARKSAPEAVTAEADWFAAIVLPIIREAQKAGAVTLREIAAALNARGVATARRRPMARQVREQHP